MGLILTKGKPHVYPALAGFRGVKVGSLGGFSGLFGLPPYDDRTIPLG